MATLDDVHNLLIEVRQRLAELEARLETGRLFRSAPLREQMFTCAKCGQNIKAYGESGEGFVTYFVEGEKHYHNRCVKT